MKIAKVFLLSLMIPLSCFAEKADWLQSFMRSKSLKCAMDEDRLKDQVSSHLDRNIEALTEALKERGSDFQEIEQKRDSVQIGVFSKSSDYDFYVLETVNVVMRGFRFPIQTTYLADNQTVTEKGLWFPLKVKDAGRKKPCVVQRITVRDGQQNLRPDVSLVFGNPERVVASKLFDVVDLETNQPEAAPATKAPEEIEKATEQDLEQAREDRRARLRRERREERRERRRHRHRHHRRHRSEINESSSSCAGDVSPWKKITCKLAGR